MSLENRNTSTSSDTRLPRDQFSVGSPDESSNALVIYSNSSNSTSEPSKKKRKSTEIDNSTDSSNNVGSDSLPTENLSDIKAFVDQIVKEMKDLRKCKLAVIHYGSYSTGKTFPKDIDIDVKFGNPYPRAVSSHSTVPIESLAEKEKAIWDKAKAEIVALRLETLQETFARTEEAIAKMSDPRNIADHVKNIAPDSIALAMQAFETVHATRVTEVTRLFEQQDKEFEAREAKRLKKLQQQQDEANRMETDDHTEVGSESEDQASSIKKLKERMASMEKLLNDVKNQLAEKKKSPNKTRKNGYAPERKGRGKPVPQKKKGEKAFSSRPSRPNQENVRRTPYKEALLRRPKGNSPPPRTQQERGKDKSYPRGRSVKVQSNTFNRKNGPPNERLRNPKTKPNKTPHSYPKRNGNATVSGNRGKR